MGLWASSPSEAWVPGAHSSGEAGRGFIALYDLAAEVPSCHFRYSHGTFRSRRGDLNPTRQWDKQEVTSSEEHVKWEVLSKPFSETTTCLVSHWGKKKMSSGAFPRTARMVKYNTIYSMTKSIKRCGRKRCLKETFDEV